MSEVNIYEPSLMTLIVVVLAGDAFHMSTSCEVDCHPQDDMDTQWSLTIDFLLFLVALLTRHCLTIFIASNLTNCSCHG